MGTPFKQILYFFEIVVVLSFSSQSLFQNEQQSIEWYICKANLINVNGTIISNWNLKNYNLKYCKKLCRLGTILSSLIDKDCKVSDSIYFNDNLLRYKDISIAKSDTYLYWYLGFFTTCITETQAINITTITQIEFKGVNYYGDYYINGHYLNKDRMMYKGMFHSIIFDITPYLNTDSHTDTSKVDSKTGLITNTIAVLVHPPDHPGYVEKGGQGGDHTVARNGAIMQYTAGWDWIQSTPDRNTGIYDQVILRYTGYIELLNPYLTTTSITHEADDKYSAYIDGSVSIKNHLSTILNATVTMDIRDIHGNIVASHTKHITNLPPLESYTIHIHDVVIKHVRLWWPHTHGQPYLYTVTWQVFIDTHPLHTLHPRLFPSPSSTISHKLGVRTVQGYIDPVTQGWAFKVNNVPIFLVG